MIEPVVVAWDGAPAGLHVRLPAGAADDDFGVVIEHESGDESRWSRRELGIEIAAGAGRPMRPTTSSTSRSSSPLVSSRAGIGSGASAAPITRTPR